MNDITDTNRTVRNTILALCRVSEQTEVRVFSYLCERPDYPNGRHAPTHLSQLAPLAPAAFELRGLRP